MKKILLFILFILPIIVFSQSVDITWEDSDGREFSINSHTREFTYSMISGDRISYNRDGSVKSIGHEPIYYNGEYSSRGPEGSVQSVGHLEIYYYGEYSSGPEGCVERIGGMKIYYYGEYGSGPEGTFKETIGNIH